MKEHFRKIISLIVVCYVLLSSFSVSSFAYTNLVNSDMSSSDWSWQSVSDFIPTITYTSSSDENLIACNSNLNGMAAIRQTVLPNEDIFANHVYKLSFNFKGYFSTCNLIPYLYVKVDNNNSAYISLASIDYNSASSYSDYSYEVKLSDYKYDGTHYIQSAIKIELVFDIEVTNNSAHNLYIKNLSLIDTDNNDDSGFWASLWNWLQDIYNQLVGLGNRITSNLASLGQTIGGFFSDLWDNISDGFESIGDWFVDLGEDIGEFFDMLIDYVLYFQHPVELNEDGVPVDEYGEPIYENTFDIPDFFETIDDWIEDIDDSKASIEAGADDGITIIGEVIVPFNSLLSRVPVILIFVTFALAVIVIKKVIA